MASSRAIDIVKMGQTVVLSNQSSFVRAVVKDIRFRDEEGDVVGGIRSANRLAEASDRFTIFTEGDRSCPLCAVLTEGMDRYPPEDTLPSVYDLNRDLYEG